MTDLVIRDKKTLRRIRDELVEAGYIEVTAGVGKSSTTYALLDMTSEPQTPKTSQPRPKPRGERRGSFDTNEFFMDAVRRSFGEDFDPKIFET